MKYTDINFDKNALILFDGECMFCNKTIQFILKNDKKERFFFAALQSEIGQYVKDLHFGDTSALDSIILVDKEGVHFKSTAVLKIFKHCGSISWLSYLTNWMLVSIRDFFYDTFVKKRYTIFGKSDTCMLSALNVRQRFFM